MNRFVILLSFAQLVWLTPLAHGHDPLLDLPPPTSVPEAWCNINASVENIARLFETNQLPVIAFQVANCSPAIRTLQAKLPQDITADARRAELQETFGLGAELIEITRSNDRPRERGQAAYESYRKRWDKIRTHYTPAELGATVYVCPMHPLDRHLEREARCTVCDMALIRRRIPASPVYESPGAPSMKLVATPDAPLSPGKVARVTTKLTRLDGSPVKEADLVVMHTQRIHLLIIDLSLDNYHHEHPTPTDTPGEYVFTFTPRRPGPYRVFADVVPAETSVQEYVVADIPSDTQGQPITDRETKLVDVVDGLRYELQFESGKLTPPLRANQTIRCRITVTDKNGKPFRRLEPVMGAYAHFVGFADDRKTVVHLHPQGNEPKRPEDRGGPTLEFKLHAPKDGFIRFYAQTQIAGEQEFAKFGVPFETP